MQVLRTEKLRRRGMVCTCQAVVSPCGVECVLGTLAHTLSKTTYYLLLTTYYLLLTTYYYLLTTYH